ncbi:MAG: amino acid adenylation domain-containing protein, partial [bacterium]|nr:amino acid adenylation domain-containing protein [bacterium]
DCPPQRVREVLNDSRAAVLLAESSHIAGLEDCYTPVLFPDKPQPENENHTVLSDADSDTNMNSLSYVIYTSGSTGRHKGVMVEHIGMMNHIGSKINDLQLTADCTVVQNASQTFDISVWQYFTALVLGGRTVVFSDDWVFEPEQFIAGVIRQRVTILEVVPSYLSVMLEFLDYNHSDFDSLRYLLVTGETVKPILVKRWFERYPGIPMVNAYGPTEASDDITHFVMDKAPEGERISIGKPVQNFNLYIVDSNMNLCPMGIKGEICAAGVGVGRGYLNNADKTLAAFTTDPFADREVRLYKTGDLGRWTADGTIEFFGRKDYQVKIRGFRIELGEIESCLSTHPHIKETAAIVLENTGADTGGDKYIAAFFVSPDTLEIDELREYLLQRLPDYMVPEQFARLEHMPLTRNGKIDRNALGRLEAGARAGNAYTAPRNHMEKKLVEIWAELLGRQEEAIGIDANFFDLGGHSLKATILAAKIHREFNLKIQLAAIFEFQTIRELAGFLKGVGRDAFEAIEKAEKMEYYPLTPAQKRLYILQQMGPGGTVYNMPGLISLEETPDMDKLTDIFKKIIRRHESLRTSFRMVDEMPVQQIHETVDFQIEYFNAEGEQTGRQEDDLVQPFDLCKAPLLRAGVIHKQGSPVLFVDMHHIISDGVSNQLLEIEFNTITNGDEPPVLRLQYTDYAQWQNSPKQQEKVKEQEAYWLSTFPGELAVLDLPTDYIRQPVRSSEGNTVAFALDKKESDILKHTVGETGATLFMVILSVFNILLCKLSGREDIIVGTPVAARRHTDLQNIIGMFVNTLALRNFPTGDKTFGEFLSGLKEQVLEAFDNQEYQFEELVDKLSLQRDAGHNPVFDVLFNLLNQAEYSGESIDSDTEGTSNHRFGRDVAKFDITLTGIDLGETLYFTLDYSTKLFKPATIERFIRYFRKLISQLHIGAGTGDSPTIARMDIIDDEEKEQLLHGFNDTSTHFPKEKTIHQLFEAQVGRTPDNLCLAGKSIRLHRDILLTYRELDKKANQLAAVLRNKGAQREEILGLMVGRSLEMVIGILAILKSGGAYLPIAPDYPVKRIHGMLEQGQVQILLTQKQAVETYQKDFKVVDLETPELFTGTPALPANINSPADLIYINYTSGSSGKPKGVMVEHRNVSRLVKNTNFYPFTVGDKMMQSGALEFDASTFEIWGAVLNGLSL